MRLIMCGVLMLLQMRKMIAGLISLERTSQNKRWKCYTLAEDTVNQKFIGSN